MPLTALINDKVICMHGGLSPDIKNIDQLKEIDRPCKVPDKGLICDLLWSDPEDYITGWNVNIRGISYVFGADIVEDFLN